MNWEDATNYSRSDSERKQTAWAIETGQLRIFISNSHRYYPEAWFVSCFSIGLESIMKIPYSSTPEQAQEHAIKIVKQRLQKMINSLP